MNFIVNPETGVHFHDLHPPLADFKQEVVSGLSRSQKCLSPKFFYDQRGSELFEEITQLPEYYPTRTEIALLQKHAREVAEVLGEDCLLIELGSGSSRKIRLLLDALQPAAYMPLDISRDFLLESANTLAADYPALTIYATCVDYSNDFELPVTSHNVHKAAFFPGSSIGNFEPKAALALLHRVAKILGQGGILLVGVDLKKTPAKLHAAYNDAQAVTAAFNMNLLTRINRELAADFDESGFHHHAFYNIPESRMEMHLVSATAQQVCVDGCAFQFEEGESIHTENSYKYTLPSFHQLAGQAGFSVAQVWQDTAKLFSIHALKVL